jgi:5,10-methylene-tetrahydrofolate dehydrogenase/methenyl tetrahydrofolate cyclohydrolase
VLKDLDGSGVGLPTIAALMANFVRAVKMQRGRQKFSFQR